MDGKLEIILAKSMIGRPEKHRRILKGMGLTKVGQTVVLEDTPAIRGMAFKILHLVKIKGEHTNEAA
jgi:large subunit ribosomal protein L30